MCHFNPVLEWIFSVFFLKIGSDGIESIKTKKLSNHVYVNQIPKRAMNPTKIVQDYLKFHG